MMVMAMLLLVTDRRPVEYIVLPTFAIEHKIYLGPFARKFPEAQASISAPLVIST